jgi:Protein of unknown function (DUF2806)
MPDEEELPTIREALSDWLGVQLPAPHMPQTIRNLDKAIATVVLALGENVSTRIKANASESKARSKLNVEGMYRTAEEKRKLENRAATTAAAMEEMQAAPSSTDAKQEIDDDWLNLFARLSEDKSSDELRKLFGKILAGEIQAPGSFSLRTIQVLAIVSKRELAAISKFLSYNVRGIVPYQEANQHDPDAVLRTLMEELGIAGHPSSIGGMSIKVLLPPDASQVLEGRNRAILVQNNSASELGFSVGGQIVSSVGMELLPISNCQTTDIEFLKSVGLKIHNDLLQKHPEDCEKGRISVSIVELPSIKVLDGITGRKNYRVLHKF